MNYILNDNGYIGAYLLNGSMIGGKNYDRELPEDFNENWMYYKVINDNLVLDLEEKEKNANAELVFNRVLDLKDYLKETDYNCEKILEGLFDVLCNSTPLTLVPNLLSYVASIKDNYIKVFEQRQAAREEINELEN